MAAGRRHIIAAMSARLGFAVAASAGAALAVPAAAAADPFAIGGWIGPRFYSNDSALGYIATAPEHPNLTNGMGLGARLAKPILPWLVPEVERPMSIQATHRFEGHL